MNLAKNVECDVCGKIYGVAVKLSYLNIYICYDDLVELMTEAKEAEHRLKKALGKQSRSPNEG